MSHYTNYEKLSATQKQQVLAKGWRIDDLKPLNAFEYGLDVAGNVTNRRELDPAQAEIEELQRLATVTPDLALRKSYAAKLEDALQKAGRSMVVVIRSERDPDTQADDEPYHQQPPKPIQRKTVLSLAEAKAELDRVIRADEFGEWQHMAEVLVGNQVVAHISPNGRIWSGRSGSTDGEELAPNLTAADFGKAQDGDVEKKSILPLKKKPELMSAKEINQTLEALEQQSSQLNDQMIAAGRGEWRYGKEITQAAEAGDPLSVQIVAVDDAMDALRSEITARYGSRIHRLPEGQRGFGPRKAAGYLKAEGGNMQKSDYGLNGPRLDDLTPAEKASAFRVGTVLSYEDMANPRRELTITGFNVSRWGTDAWLVDEVGVTDSVRIDSGFQRGWRLVRVGTGAGPTS